MQITIPIALNIMQRCLVMSNFDCVCSCHPFLCLLSCMCPLGLYLVMSSQACYNNNNNNNNNNISTGNSKAN